MTAPTGRAAYVLRDRHQIEAGTIHRSIYSLRDLKEYREVDENGDVTYKFYFETRNNDIDHDTVFIVDEASMIALAAGLFAPSGHQCSPIFWKGYFGATEDRPSRDRRPQSGPRPLTNQAPLELCDRHQDVHLQPPRRIRVARVDPLTRTHQRNLQFHKREALGARRMD